MTLRLSSAQKEPRFCELFKNILHRFLLEVIRETLQTPIKTFPKYYDQKVIIFSDISLLRLRKNMSIAMENMTESQKNKNKLCQSTVKNLVLDYRNIIILRMYKHNALLSKIS